MSTIPDDLAAMARLPHCACGAEPAIIGPGSDGEYTDLLGQRLYTIRPVGDLALCLACATAQGWPSWPQEKRA